MAWDDRPYYRDEPPRLRLSVPSPTPLTMALMGACLLSFLLVNVFRLHSLEQWGALRFQNALAFKQPWRWITYAYLHGGGMHIFWNLLGLYFFIPPLERVWGWRKTLLFYTLGTVVAGLTFGIMCIFFPFYELIGASGGILAALGACAYLFPEMSFFGIIPIRVAAGLLGVLYLLTIAGDKDASDAAHLGGLVFGFFLPYYGRSAWTRLDKKLARRRVRREVDIERAEQETIDRILAKVHDKGMNSLTYFERRALRKATERQRLADAARERQPY